MYNKEIATALHGLGVSITPAYVGQLLDGTRDNPTRDVLRGLAELYGVPVGYLASNCPVLEDATMSSLSVTDRVNLLFDVSGPHAAPITDAQVAAAIDVPVDDIRSLRDGTGDPPLSVLSRFAAFFGVSLSFLTDTEATSDETRQRLLPIAGVDAELRSLVRRTSDLVEPNRVAVATSMLAMVQAMETLEQRADSDASKPGGVLPSV